MVDSIHVFPPISSASKCLVFTKFMEVRGLLLVLSGIVWRESSTRPVQGQPVCASVALLLVLWLMPVCGVSKRLIVKQCAQN